MEIDLLFVLTLMLYVDKGWSSSKISEAQRAGVSPEELLLGPLLRNYDQHVRPPATNSSGKGPVLVYVNIMLRMLSKIDVVNMEYNMQITFRERWLDKRLAYQHLGRPEVLPKFLTVPHIKDSVWIPDSFFPTEKSAHRHHIDTENMFLRVYPDGQILYSVRLSMTLSCPMHLQLYPLDVQHCDFDLISYAHTTTDIVYQWDMDSGTPVQVKPGVSNDLPNFVLTSIDTNHECTSHTNTGSYACLRMRLTLTRQFSYYIVQQYLPTTMIVIVSWVSFWIDMHSTAGRVALGVTTLLTMTTLQSSINAKLPPVNYVKVIDVWLGACQTFVFGALLEYAFVSYHDNCLQAKLKMEPLRRSQKRRQKLELIEEIDTYQPPCTCHLFDPQPYRPTLTDRFRKMFTRPTYLPARIDFYARFSVPAGFFLFNMVYWSFCYVATSEAKKG